MTSRDVEQKIRLASWPGPGGRNPYRDLFHRALQNHGIESQLDCQIDDQWLRDHAHRTDAIHLHWPEGIWRRAKGPSILGLRRVMGLRKYLQLAGQLGIQRVWTLHNLEHHEGSSWVDRTGYRLLARESDLIICHSDSTAEVLRDSFGPTGSVVVMAHGNYDGVFPEPGDRPTLLTDLGLRNDLPLFSLVGNLRDYKGLGLIPAVASELKDEAQFLIAGRAHPDYDIEKLEHEARTIPGLKILNRALSDQEFADIVTASEATLLPYLRITGSGALLAAWTLGCPVIASDLGYFKEVAAPEPQALRVFKTGDPSALADAVRAHLGDRSTGTRESVRRLSDFYDWNRTVSPVAEAIRSWKDAVQGNRASSSLGADACVDRSDGLNAGLPNQDLKASR